MQSRKKIPASLRYKIWGMYGGRCAYCGTPMKYKELQIDHVVPLHRHGVDEEKNYFPACRICNHYKSSYTIEGFRSQLGLLTKRLEKNVYIYRLAMRYRMIQENNKEVKFYFEKIEGGDEEGKQ